VGRNPPQKLQGKEIKAVASKLKKEHPQLTVAEAKALALEAIESRTEEKLEKLAEAELAIPEDRAIAEAIQEFASEHGVLPDEHTAEQIVQDVKRKRARYVTKAKVKKAEEFGKKFNEKIAFDALKQAYADRQRYKEIGKQAQERLSSGRQRSLSDENISYVTGQPLSSRLGLSGVNPLARPSLIPRLSSSVPSVSLDPYGSIQSSASISSSSVVPSVSVSTVPQPSSDYQRFLARKQAEQDALSGNPLLGLSGQP
jgi:hypothetical protein